jgi:hypothetical protein
LTPTVQIQRRLAALALAALGWCALSASEDSTPTADAARAVLAAQAPNVVTVRITAKVRISAADAGSTDVDMAVEATGLLLDPKGLIVCSLSATDPQKFYEQYLEEEEEADEYSMSTEIVKISIMFEGGGEEEADAGLRDTDLDLAYFTLKSAAPKGSAVRPAKAAPRPFDSLVVLRRLGDVSGRVCAGALLPVQALVERPRRFYVVSNDITVGLGEPVFDLNGGCVGVVTLRRIRSAGSPTYFLFSGEDPYSAVVVLPIADVLDGAAQHEKFDHLGSAR